MSKFRRVSPALGVWGEHENLCGADCLFLFLGIEESLAYGKITLSSKFTFMRHCMSTSSSRFEFWGKFHNVIDSRKKYLSTSKKVETKNFPKTYKKLPIRKIVISHGRLLRKTNIKNEKIKGNNDSGDLHGWQINNLCSSFQLRLKVILDWVGFASLRSVNGPKKTPITFHQTDAKLKPIAICLFVFFRASSSLPFVV